MTAAARPKVLPLPLPAPVAPPHVEAFISTDDARQALSVIRGYVRMIPDARDATAREKLVQLATEGVDALAALCGNAEAHARAAAAERAAHPPEPDRLVEARSYLAAIRRSTHGSVWGCVNYRMPDDGEDSVEVSLHVKGDLGSLLLASTKMAGAATARCVHRDVAGGFADFEWFTAGGIRVTARVSL